MVQCLFHICWCIDFWLFEFIFVFEFICLISYENYKTFLYSLLPFSFGPASLSAQHHTATQPALRLPPPQLHFQHSVVFIRSDMQPRMTNPSSPSSRCNQARPKIGYMSATLARTALFLPAHQGTPSLYKGSCCRTPRVFHPKTLATSSSTHHCKPSAATTFNLSRHRLLVDVKANGASQVGGKDGDAACSCTCRSFAVMSCPPRRATHHRRCLRVHLDTLDEFAASSTSSWTKPHHRRSSIYRFEVQIRSDRVKYLSTQVSPAILA
jgi:hypothetical protein